MAISGSLEVGKRALLAMQLAQQIVGHNVANAATRGYSRQRVELQPTPPLNYPRFSVGTGVDVAGIRRIRDLFTDLQLLGESQILGQGEALTQILERIEALLNEPQESGLMTLLDQFFASLQDLSTRPEDPLIRVNVRERGRTLTQGFQQLHARLLELKSDVGEQIRSKVDEANPLITEIAELNRQIRNTEVGSREANDLRDRQGVLVDRLAKLVGVAVTERSDGTTQVALHGSGMLLVDGTIANALSASLNAAADEMEVFLSGIEVFPQEGEVAGLLTMRNSTTEGVKKYLSDLNALAREVIDEVNRLHSDGAGLTGHTTHTSTNAVSGPLVPLTGAGLPFTPLTGSFDVIVHDPTGAVLSTVTVAVTAGVTTLEDVRAAIDADPTLTATISGGLLTVTAGGGSSFTFANDDSDALLALGLNGFFEGADASNIQISALIDGDLAKIAAARADAAGLVHPGDSVNARALAQLKDALTLAGGTLGFGGFYASMVETVGQATQESARFVENQERVVELLRNFREEISGVSLDEEMTELIKFQHAYEAAARFIRVADEMLDTLINQM